MSLKKEHSKKRFIYIGTAVAGTLLICLLIFQVSGNRESQAPESRSSDKKSVRVTEEGIRVLPDGMVQGEIVSQPHIDYGSLKKDEELKSLMASRKERLGIKQSLDMIVRSDEQFKVGDNKVSMGDILKEAFVEQQMVYQEEITPSGEIRPATRNEYGIYVVQPGDNIWNIHFNILKEYYEHRGINVSPKADEPVNKGLSSGVGKILKFSENMVIIYNLAEKRTTRNIDLLEPLSKVVIYNMDEVFSLLKDISYNNIDRIQFDGKTIWIPAKKQ